MSDNLPAPILPEFPPKSEFRKWLRSLPPDARVAEDWTCFTCPLAQWLTARGMEAPYVRPDAGAAESAWRVIGDHALVRLLPKWANDFGCRIDILGRWRCAGRTNRYGPVTADDCLAVLCKTPRE